jgi:hypothetical protein
MLWVTVIGIILLGFYTGLTACQANASRKTLHYLASQDRPWVRLADAKITKIVVEPNSVSALLAYHFENVGHSPAQHMSIESHILTTDPAQLVYATREASRRCGTLTNGDVGLSPWLDSGIIVFPGTSTAQSDIAQVKSSTLWAWQDYMVGIFTRFTKNVGAGYRQRAQANERFVTQFWVQGCVGYTGADNVVHTTTFVLRVIRPPFVSIISTGGGPPPDMIADLDGPRDQPSDGLDLSEVIAESAN